MKMMITMVLSAFFIAASSGTTAEEGLMKAIAKTDNQPKPLISVAAIGRSNQTKHIRELHGDLGSSLVSLQANKGNLARYKAKLKKQKHARLLGLSRNKTTVAY